MPKIGAAPHAVVRSTVRLSGEHEVPTWVQLASKKQASLSGLPMQPSSYNQQHDVMLLVIAGGICATLLLGSRAIARMRLCAQYFGIVTKLCVCGYLDNTVVNGWCSAPAPCRTGHDGANESMSW
jgi:hypothetical protein